MPPINIEHWVFMFFIFTMIGWVHETTVESLYHKKFVNRGSLKGPYIPIYGFGGCVIILCAYPFRYNGFFVFLSGLICCTILEYFTGWLMEKMFHRQFWDYSMLKLTYKNRISLLSSLCWGALSLLQIYIIFPFLSWFGLYLGSVVMAIFDCIMMIIVSIDIIVTVKSSLGWQNVAKKLSPEQIKLAINKKRMQVGRIFGHFGSALNRNRKAAKRNADFQENTDIEIEEENISK